VTSAALASIAAGGFVVAFLHAALPTHWLPFVLVGRGRSWSVGKTLGVAAGAGVGHVIFTIVLGLGVVAAGSLVEPRFGEAFHWLVGGLMMALGLFYLLRHARHGHPQAAPRRYGSDRAAMTGLFVLLALSPCEVFLPVYLQGVRHGLTGFLVLSGVLAAATATGMLLFTGLSLVSARRLKIEALERHESAILGGVLILIGLAVILFES
jgi:nickel/cobalt exporter